MPFLAYSCNRYSVELGFKIGPSNQSTIWVVYSWKIVVCIQGNLNETSNTPIYLVDYM